MSSSYAQRLNLAYSCGDNTESCKAQGTSICYLAGWWVPRVPEYPNVQMYKKDCTEPQLPKEEDPLSLSCSFEEKSNIIDCFASGGTPNYSWKCDGIDYGEGCAFDFNEGSSFATVTTACVDGFDIVVTDSEGNSKFEEFVCNNEVCVGEYSSCEVNSDNTDNCCEGLTCADEGDGLQCLLEETCGELNENCEVYSDNTDSCCDGLTCAEGGNGLECLPEEEEECKEEGTECNPMEKECCQDLFCRETAETFVCSQCIENDSPIECLDNSNCCSGYCDLPPVFDFNEIRTGTCRDKPEEECVGNYHDCSVDPCCDGLFCVNTEEYNLNWSNFENVCITAEQKDQL